MINNTEFRKNKELVDKYESDIDDYLEYKTGCRVEDPIVKEMTKKKVNITNLSERFGIPMSEVYKSIEKHEINIIEGSSELEGGWPFNRISLLDFYWIANQFGKFPD